MSKKRAIGATDDILKYSLSNPIYDVDRQDFQDIFSNFLNANGFEAPYGLIDDNALRKHERIAYGIAHIVEENCEYSREFIEQNAHKMTFDEVTSSDLDFEPPDEAYYAYQGRVYCLYDDIEIVDYDDFTSKSTPAIMKLRPVLEYHTYFDNGVFAVNPYYWGDSVRIRNMPNFVHYESGLAISCYKYFMRGARSNQEIDRSRFFDILADCERSLRNG